MPMATLGLASPHHPLRTPIVAGAGYVLWDALN